MWQALQNFFKNKHSRQRAAPWGICQKRLTALPFYLYFIILLECFQMVSEIKIGKDEKQFPYRKQMIFLHDFSPYT